MSKHRRCDKSSQFEILEDRSLFSSALASNVRVPATDLRHTASRTTAHTQYVVLRSHNKAKPNAGSGGPGGKTPAQIRKAYGVDQISFNGITGDGTGQTIAIIDAFDDPSFVSSTNTNFVNSDLHRFDLQFGLADPPSFTKESQTGSTTSFPAANSGWDGEIALDVEWSHSMAPNANILLVEASSASTSNLNAAVNFAKKQAGVSVITMSYGGAEFSGEASSDSVYTTPSSHTGVTFLASTGDSGSPGEYQAFSPNVVAVGGTSLNIANGAGLYGSETAWSDGGGGVSQFESIPSYQKLITTTSSTKHTIPDVSADADPNTGVSVLDTSASGIGSANGWFVYGGTSVSSPLWAGMIAIADQGRAQLGLSPLDGKSQTLPRLYTLSSTDFHDVTTGSNGGFSAGVGYDAVTGRGTPIANQLIPDLAGGATITGTVYEDANGNASLDNGEAPVAGATVYLDLNNNGTLDSNEPTTTTSLTGAYSFSDLVGRTYTVRQLTPSGDIATSSSAVSVTASYGQTSTQNFGVFPSFNSTFSGASITLSLDPTGKTLEVSNNNGDLTPNEAIPKSLISSLALTGTSGDDVLTVDLTNGNPLAGVNISYDGGAFAAAGNSVNILGTSAQDTATFSNNAITIDGGTLNITNVQNAGFDGRGGLDLLTDNASQPLLLAANQNLQSLSLGASASAILTPGGNVLSTQSLSLASGAKLDLTDGGLIDNNPVDLSGIATSLASGYNSGLWSGVGINSLTATADASQTHALGYITAGDFGITNFMGQSVNSNAILVRYTQYGDNDLDGKVDLGNDFAALQAGLNGQLHGWEGGDYNYDGVIDSTNDFATFLNALSNAQQSA